MPTAAVPPSVRREHGFYALADADGLPVGIRIPGVLTFTTAELTESIDFEADHAPLVAMVTDAVATPDPDGLVPPGGRFGFWAHDALIWTSSTMQPDPDGTVTFYAAPASS